MLFYGLLIEPYTSTQIKIYGREVKENGKERTYGSKKHLIVNILPEYLFYLKNLDHLDIKETLKNEKYEIIDKLNYFHENMPEKVTLVRSQSKNVLDLLKKRIESETDENDRFFTEYNSLVEQFVITKKVKGPCIFEIGNIGEAYSHFVCDSDSISVKESNVEYPPLTIGTCFVSGGFMKVNVYEFKDRLYKHKKIMKYNQLDDEIDVVVHHNLRINGKPGIWLIDTFECAKILIKGRSFSLDEILKGKKCDDQTLEVFLSLNILDLSKELSEIAGHFIQKTMTLRAERTEYLLMHVMAASGWLIYNKNKRQHNKPSFDDIADEVPAEEQTYTGGLVISPKTGLFNDVILIDFNSLYPSIVIENDLCFSTRKRLLSEEADDLETEAEPSGENMALLPKILLSLIERRKNLKKQLKMLAENDKRRRIYDARQHALKITANSIYGCLGSQNRFADVKMASYITAKGRGLLVQAKNEIEALGYEVVYGDTDSLMIHIKSSDLQRENEKINTSTSDLNQLTETNKNNLIKSISDLLCGTVNKLYQYIVIELEDIFDTILFLSKKKYAGLTNTGNIVMKGLERRDYCKLSNNFISEIINIILRHDENNLEEGSDEEKETLFNKIMKKLVDLKSDIKKYPTSHFILERLLAKPPEKYKAPQGSAHVMLALRINSLTRSKNSAHNTLNKENIPDKNKNLIFKKNDIISYIIGENNEAFLPNEITSVNHDYYISNQILAPLMRILGVLPRFNIDPIRKLFGVEIRNKPVGSFRICTDCCKNEQSNTSQCMKCGENISKDWLETEIRAKIIEKVDILYERKYVCSDCDHQQQIRLRCFNCNSGNLIFEGIDKKNKDFDQFISDTQAQTNSEYVDKIIQLSEYRIVDLSLYFPDEIINNTKL